MGRKPKNESTEARLAFKENSKIKNYDVKMPFLYSITVQINDPNFAKAKAVREYYVKQDSNLDGLIKEIENNQFLKVKVIKVEPAVRPHTDLCPRCHNRGVPKIEKKDTGDYRERSWRNKEQTSPQKKREPEFWLTYTHSKIKKCRICQYVTPYPSYKHNKINIEKYYFPQIIGNMKRGSIQYSDQEQ